MREADVSDADMSDADMSAQGAPVGGCGVLSRMPSMFAALVLSLAVSACSLFGTSRPDPPPYPATSEDQTYQLAWTSGSLGKALPGFRPAVTSDSVWTASAGGAVRRLSRETGQVELLVQLPERLSAGAGSDGTMVVVVSRDGEVIALDDTGRRRWSTPLKGEFITAPAVAESAVVVRTVDGRIVALDRDGGSIKWTFQRPMPTLILRQSAPLVISDDTVYAGLPGARVTALDLRVGAPRWENVIATPRGATELERLVDIAGSPVVGSGQICAVAYQGKLACLRADDGRIVWSRDISSSSGLAVAGDTVVTVDGSDVIQALKPTGDALWKQDGLVRRGLTAPVLVDERVLFGDRFGNLSVLSLADGSPLARLTLDGSALASVPVVVNDVAYVQTVDGTVAALAVK